MLKNKKVMALVISFSLVLTFLTMFTVSASTVSITNANLNDVNAIPRPVDWGVYGGGGTLFSDNTVKRGDGGYSVKMSDYTAYATLTGTVTGAEIGKMYVVSCYFYVGKAPDSGTGTVQLYSMLSHSNGDTTSSPTVDSITINKNFVDGKWHYFRHVFVADSLDTPNIAIYTLGTGFTIYVDDFSIEETNNLFAFGGNSGQTKVTGDYNFEVNQPAGVYSWTINNTSGSPNISAVYDNSDPIEGQFSLKLTKLLDQNNGLHRVIAPGALQNGVQYKLSYKIKAIPVTQGDNSVTMAIRLIEGTNIWHSAVATLEWEQHEFYFKLTDTFASTTTSIPMYLNLHGGSSNAVIGDSVLVDDICITRANNELGFKNSKGFDTTTANAGDIVTAKLARVAGNGNTETVLYILGTYEVDNVTGYEKLVTLNYFNNVTSSGILTNTITTSVTMPNIKEGKTYNIKGFVWDGAESLKPCVDSVKVTQSK